MKTLIYVLAAVLNIGLTLTVQILDKRRLTQEQRAGAWNAASWGAALYGAFFVGGAASMIPWCWVTRQEWRRWRKQGLAKALGRSALLLGAGLGIAVVVYAVVLGTATLAASALGVPDLD